MEEVKQTPYEVLTIQEYLDRRKGKQSIDQSEAECYDTWMKQFLYTKEIEKWHY